MRLSQIAIGRWHILLFIPAVLAQNDATPTSSPATLSTATSHSHTGSPSFLPGYFGSSSSLVPGASPTGHDNAPSGNNNNSLDSGGLVNYYFVFLALLLCCLGLAIFFIMRRRSRARRRGLMSSGRESALERDLGGAGGLYTRSGHRGQRRYWQGRWRSAETSREEGLNELGEAPPAYLPKRQSEERRRSAETGANAPAIPLQTLSRDDVGLKPPDYSEASTYEVHPNVRHSSASGSSSRTPEPHTNL